MAARIGRVFQPGGGVIWIRDDGERFFDWYATVQRWRARRKP